MESSLIEWGSYLIELESSWIEELFKLIEHTEYVCQFGVLYMYGTQNWHVLDQI